MKSGIYILFWANSGERTYFYIGQSANVNARLSNHCRCLKNGSHDNSRLQRVFNKYGMPETMVVKLCQVDQLNTEEQKLLDAFFNHPSCCNINPSSENNRGWKRSDKTKKLISERRKGTKLSADHKNSISKGLRIAYQEHRKKPDLRGDKNPFFGRKHDTAALGKMKNTSKNCGADNIKARLVIDLQTGIFYDFAGQAAEAKGYKTQHLWKMLGGWRKNRSGLMYADQG